MEYDVLWCFYDFYDVFVMGYDVLWQDMMWFVMCVVEIMGWGIWKEEGKSGDTIMFHCFKNTDRNVCFTDVIYDVLWCDVMCFMML